MATPFNPFEASLAIVKANAVIPAEPGTLQVFVPPCECPTCLDQWRSIEEQPQRAQYLYPGVVTDAKTAALSREFCTSIFEDLQKVDSILRLQGDPLRKRWLKKTNTKRKAYLQQLRPNMWVSQTAFLDIGMTTSHDLENRQYRETFLLPWLTVETLARDGSKLLRLLENRVVHPPEAWVPFDNRQLEAGWTLGALEERFNAGCIDMYGKSYGRYRDFDKASGK